MQTMIKDAAYFFAKESRSDEKISPAPDRNQTHDILSRVLFHFLATNSDQSQNFDKWNA